MYTLRTIKKSERMNAFNQSLGDNYHLIDRHNETYYQLRERHFGVMGFSSEQTAKYNNPFVVGKDFSMPIYLEDGHEYYIMTESGKTFENLSGLVGDVMEESKTPTPEASACIPSSDVLDRPSNYSLHQIFNVLKAGRKAADQLMLQELIDVLDTGENFAVITTSDFDYYNNLLSKLIVNHIGTFREATDVSYEFKERQLRNRGYSPTETLK